MKDSKCSINGGWLNTLLDINRLDGYIILETTKRNIFEKQPQAT